MSVPESPEVIFERVRRLRQRYYRTRQYEAAILTEAIQQATRAMKGFAAAMQGFRLPPE